MVRIIAAVILGYALILMIVFAGIGTAWSVMGPEGAFRGDTWETSGTWVATILAVGAIAAVIAGAAARRIARSPAGPASLAGVVLVLGVLTGVMQLMAAPESLPAGEETEAAVEPEPEPRPRQVAWADAMNNAKPPRWYPFVNTVLGGAGVLIGGLLLAGGTGRDGGLAAGEGLGHG
jgi:hypothetical protein